LWCFSEIFLLKIAFNLMNLEPPNTFSQRSSVISTIGHFFEHLLLNYSKKRPTLIATLKYGIYMPVVKLYHSQIVKTATKYKSNPPRLPWNNKYGIHTKLVYCIGLLRINFLKSDFTKIFFQFSHCERTSKPGQEKIANKKITTYYILDFENSLFWWIFRIDANIQTILVESDICFTILCDNWQFGRDYKLIV